MSEDSFTSITEEQYQAFIACPSFEEEYRYLIETKAITVPFAEENPRNKIIAEYFYKVINYCKSIKFNFIQTKVCCQLFEVIIKFAQTETDYGAAAKSRCTEVFKQQVGRLVGWLVGWLVKSFVDTNTLLYYVQIGCLSVDRSYQ